MKTYYVSIPVACSIDFNVQANSAKEARDIADDCLGSGRLQDGSRLPEERFYEVLDKSSWNIEEE